MHIYIQGQVCAFTNKVKVSKINCFQTNLRFFDERKTSNDLFREKIPKYFQTGQPKVLRLLSHRFPLPFSYHALSPVLLSVTLMNQSFDQLA